MKEDSATTSHSRNADSLQHSASSSNIAEVVNPEDNLTNTPLEPWRLHAILLSLCVGLLLSMMDNSIVSTSLYTIAMYFDSLENAMWTVLAYTLTYLGFAVVFAQLSDFMGRRWAVVCAFSVFLVFSLACGFAQTLEQLIVFRAFQGVGGSGLYALTLILSLEISTPKTLPLVSGLVGATIAVAGILGPILGGVLTERASWRWIFWINVPCGLLPMLIFTIATPRELPNERKARKKIANFDIIGSLLLLAAAVLVVFGVEEGGSGRYAWSSAVVLVPLVAGCLCWPTLFAWEYWLSLPSHRRQTRWSSVDAIYPTRIFTHRIMLAGIIATTFVGFIFFVVIFNLPLRSQIVNSDSPASASIRLLPLLGSLAVGSFCGGAASGKVNRTFHTFVLGTALTTLGVGLLSTLGPSQAVEKKLYGFEVIAGLGIGFTFSTVSILTTRETEVEDHAVAQGIVSQVRVFGGSIGVAAANALFRLESQTSLPGVLSDAQIRQLQTSPTIMATLTPAQGNAVRVAYADAFSATMRVCVYLGSAALLACLFTFQRSKPRGGE